MDGYLFREKNPPCTLLFGSVRLLILCPNLNEKIFDVFPGDLEQKINPPTIIQKGSYRKYYTFE